VATEIGLSAARKLASKIRGSADGGQDPQQEKRGKREAARRRRMGETVHSALASWLKDKHTGPLSRWKGGLEGGTARAITHHTKRLDRTLGKKLLADITTKDLERFIGDAVAPATKNRCLGAKVGRIRDEPRRAGLCPMAVTLLTGQRAALFAEGVSSEFVFATSTGARPLDSLKPVLYDLRGFRPCGKPGSNHKLAKKRVAAIAADVTIHDIRRTVADSLFNRIGAQPWVVDHVVLGHARPKLLRTYMPTLPLKEAREMLEKWGEEIEKILAGAFGAQGQAQ
jgi:integrase